MSLGGTAGTPFLAIDSSTGNVGIANGVTTPVGKFNVSGAVTGKALVILDETGDQAILTASGSGTTRFTLDRDGSISQVSADTTGIAYDLQADALTTGTGLSLSLDALTTGTGLLIDAAGSARTISGDLVRINLGANPTLTGDLLSIEDNGSDVFTVDPVQIESAVPHSFTAAGDVTMAYDLEFTNQTSSFIKSSAPLTIQVGESFESNNLNLETYNAGDIVFATASGTAKVLINAEGSVGIDDNTAINDPNLPYGSLVIGDGALCVDNGGTNCDDSTRIAGEIYANNATVQGLDVAENYPSNELLQAGEVVVADPDNPVYIKKSTSAYQPNILGVISTNPGFLMGGFSHEIYPENILQPVALSGRVPLRISSQNGVISPGDPLTSSSIAGVAMKATNPGQIVARALEPYSHPDPSTVGSILAFVGPSWHDPDVYIADSGDLNLVDTGSPSPATSYQLQTTSGQFIDRIGAFAEFIAANIKAGYVHAQALTVAGAIVTEELLVEGSINVAKNIKAGAITVNQLISKKGQIDELETQVISPIAGEKDVALRVGDPSGSETSGFGKLLVQNQKGETVASIDETGNATFSGTLQSDEVIATQVTTDEIIAGKIYADEIVARSGNFADTQTNTLSGITREEIEELLKEAEEDQGLLAESTSWEVSTATDSALLNELALNNLFVTEQAAIDALSVTDSIVVGSDLVIQQHTSEVLGDPTSEVARASIDTLTAPLEIQSSASQPLHIMAGLVTIDTDGNVQIAGNLAVGGTIEASGLRLTGATPVSESGFGKLLSLVDTAGVEVSSISASGAAEFASVATEKLIVTGDEQTTYNTLSGYVIETNATAGQAKVLSGSQDVIIRNPNVAFDSLIFITPTSQTQTPMFIKKQKDGEFIVGFSSPATDEVTFNWWIVGVVAKANE